MSGLRLDLACGAHPADDYMGVDIVASAARWQCNLERTPWELRPNYLHLSPVGVAAQQPVRLEEGAVAALRCSHFVEHVHNLVAFMNECDRVLEAGGELVIVHPYQFSLGAWQDPTHVRALNEVSWWYYSAKWRAEQDLDHYLGITADLEPVQFVPTRIDPEYADLPMPDLLKAMRHAVNVCLELTVTLVKR